MNFYFLLKIIFSIIYSLIYFIGQFLFTNNYYSEYKFLGEWSYGTEVIGFFEDREFAYYEPGSGNAVDDYDLCDTYLYNDFSKKFKINCTPGPIDVSREIKLVSVNDRTMTVRFGTKKKTFVKIRNYEDYEIANFWSRENNGRIENLRIYSDGDFSYTFEKDIPVDLYDKYELYDDRNFYKYSNSICSKNFTEDDFIDDYGMVIEEFQIDCPIDSLDNRYYVYDEDNNLIRIFLADDPYNEILMKIITIEDRILKVEYNGEILEFRR